MGKKWDKFMLLMWKNWTLLRRRPIHTAFEIIYPVVICLILVAIRGLTRVDEYGPIYHEPSDIKCVFDVDGNQTSVAYSPSSSLLTKTISKIIDTNLTKIIDFDDANTLNKNIENNSSFTKSLMMALIFDDSLKDIDDIQNLPPNIKLVIRPPSSDSFQHEIFWNTEFLFPSFHSPGPNDVYTEYQRHCYLYFQKEIAMNLINNNKNETKDIQIKIKEFPYPKWNQDDLYVGNVISSLTLIIVSSFMYNCINTIRAITTEKEKQLKESMKVMGLPGWLHWLAWFTRSFIILTIAIIFIDIVLVAKLNKYPVLRFSDWSVIFLFLTFYACSSITLAFSVSVLFTKANTAAAVGSLIFFVTYIPYVLLQNVTKTSLTPVLASCLLSNSALSFGMTKIFKFEAMEEGIQWSNIWKATSPDDHLTLGDILLMLILDTFLYLGIALYVEAVFPGEFGVPKPWYYLFTKSYWCKVVPVLDTNTPNASRKEYFEEVTERHSIGIQLQNLSKTFGNNNAVKKINLNMYENQISVLLGHNGAGKTTTMSMIIGMFPPSSGTAIVNGHDVRTDVQNVRDSMGICLQHNVLFDNLTVWEHLYFFGRLKGLESHEIDEEIDNYIELLELEDKKHARSSTLSGGMKRKLGVGMAMCGKSKVVILDEPTAGMDPSARRSVWNLLQKQKQGRTILLTTHFMDEADLLGDRIAIMTGGEMQCCGSSFFLKKKFGTGYYLIMDVASDCQTDKITSLLRKYIPYMNIHSKVGSELTYQLSEQECHKFENMLHDLETNTNSLGIRSYGVSLTTLEEVFMKVGADHDNEGSKAYNNGSNMNGYQDITIQTSDITFKASYLTGFPLMKNQIIAMMLKKGVSVLRNWYFLVLQIAFPVVVLTITIINARSSGVNYSFPSLAINLESYHNPIILVENGTNDLTNIYATVLNGQKVDNVSDEILKQTEKSPLYAKMHYIAAATFNNVEAIAWYRGSCFHSIPLSLSLVLNAIYKQTVGYEKSIEFFNHPLPRHLENKPRVVQFDLIGFQLAIVFGYSMAFVTSFYILFYIKERMSKAKHLQFVSGVNVFVFWGTVFLCDLITYLVIACSIIITLACLQEQGLSSSDELARVILLFLSFGFFVLPFLYLASYLFNVPSSGFSRIMLIGSVLAVVGFTTTQIFEMSNRKDVSRPLHWILLFVPFYSIANGVYNLSLMYSLRKVCSQFGNITFACSKHSECCDIDNYFSMGTPGIGRNITISFLMSFLLFIVLISNEFGFFSSILNKIFDQSKPPHKNETVEEDVQEEINKITDSDDSVLSDSYCLVLRDLTKYYKKFRAVNGLCLGVKSYECFGLLGVNGAGKTTTFKMMTGDEEISYGDVWVKGLSIRTHQKQVQRLIGYCPQFDALLDDLTARETLRIFGLIRGVPLNKVNCLGEELSHKFDFFKHLDKKLKELSGGNKRKLSTAIALIGNPPIVYLDEPTTGMDPATKRFLWTALAKLRDEGKCIILTSHSMEECEALCTRLAIMVNGNFQCLGSTQRLKNKFAQGYALTLKVKKNTDVAKLDTEITMIDKFIKENFSEAELKEKYQELLTYHLENTSMPWSRMFGILERSKRELNIEDYTLGQCSLEQVFLSFTQNQQ